MRRLNSEEVADYLRRHPDFLARRPELYGLLAAPDRKLGEGVVDLQQVLLDKLRVENARLKLAQRQLIATSRTNQTIQTRVHAAVLTLLSVSSFEHLISAITEELAVLLDVDAVGLCLEATHGAAGRLGKLAPGRSNGVQILAIGAVDELLGGPAQDIQLRPEVIGDPHLFGTAAAGLIRSDALVRLCISPASPAGLLVLGDRRPGSFGPGQGTELLVFLAGVIEQSIRAWLDLPD